MRLFLFQGLPIDRAALKSFDVDCPLTVLTVFAVFSHTVQLSVLVNYCCFPSGFIDFLRAVSGVWPLWTVLNRRAFSIFGGFVRLINCSRRQYNCRSFRSHIFNHFKSNWLAVLRVLTDTTREKRLIWLFLQHFRFDLVEDRAKLDVWNVVAISFRWLTEIICYFLNWTFRCNLLQNSRAFLVT